MFYKERNYNKMIPIGRSSNRTTETWVIILMSPRFVLEEDVKLLRHWEGRRIVELKRILVVLKAA